VADNYFTAEKAKAAFSRIEEICNEDGGKLWGTNLMGPVMFVDRTTRKTTSNFQDNEGLLKLKDGVYTGTYPRENIIITTPVTYGGTLYGLTPLPVEEDEYRIITRAIHSLYHRYQYISGIRPEYFNAVNLDGKEARILLKLEWKALKKAIESEGEEQSLAIRDALIFRGSSRELFPRYADLQNRFECYEGLATFTYILLASESPADYRTSLFEYLDRIYSFQSYSRSYGSIHGALYATLLYYKGFDFSTIRSDTLDLARIVRGLYEIDLPPVCRDVAGSIALSYNIEEINNEEDKRLLDIKERLISQAGVFTQKPVVFLELESPSFDFEPEDVQYLDTLGTLYHTIRVSDNWGKLAVDKTGCLISNNYKLLRITARGLKIEKNHLSGEGWQILLNDGWEIMNSGENYFLKKLTP
jgi:hypothetical protein